MTEKEEIREIEYISRSISHYENRALKRIITETDESIYDIRKIEDMFDYLVDINDGQYMDSNENIVNIQTVLALKSSETLDEKTYFKKLVSIEQIKRDLYKEFS